jgi:small-conductance mechanosensitive channel/CRP-like cAMP-binding protein
MSTWAGLLAELIHAVPAAPGTGLSAAAVPWRPFASAAGLVAVAGLMHRFQPKRRRRLRHTVILFGLHLLLLLLSALLLKASSPSWSKVSGDIAELFGVVTVLNLGVLLVFDLVLPALALEIPSIIADLVIGAGYLLATFHTLQESGTNLSGLIATSAVVSGVIGLSLAPTLGNVLGGVALQLDNSIHQGDWVQLGDMQGRVKEIHWRHTVVETRNWDTVVVPNATLLSANITLLGRRSDQALQRRYWVYFNVDFRFAPADVIQLVTDALQASPLPNVAKEPRPHAICFDFAGQGRDSFATYAVRYWLTDLAADDPTNSAVRERIYSALQRASIPLAVPASTVFVSQDDEEHKQRKAQRDHRRRVDLLGQVPLFKGFTPEEMAQLADEAVPTPFARGEVMTLQGRTSHFLYILARGEARVTLRLERGEEAEVAILHAPNVFGEFGVMTGNPREATVTAVCPSECLRIDREVIRKILTERPELAEVLSSVMASRAAHLESIRSNLTAEQRNKTVETERVRVLHQIERFFGLSDDK